ncbi:MAG: fibronectin type III domain-containing protein, partial [Deltaproteobacteria bacterium]|nr:fibronectin type III domain-containing protein [Deltaproteobacteria bacterium]
MSTTYPERENCSLFLTRHLSRSIILIIGFFMLLFLVVQAQAAQVTLAWDPNTETDLAGYKLYYGTSSGNYSNSVAMGNVTTYIVANLTDGVTYYFSLTAIDQEGFESGYSNEISYTSTPPTTQFILTINRTGTGNGTVTNTPTGTTFGAGTVVSLTASPSVSSLFTGWSGACSGTTSPCSVTMSANRSVAASFILKTYTLTASAGTGGSISSTGASTVNYGDNKIYTITPNSGYQIASVTVDGTPVGAVGSYTFSSVTANHAIAVTFVANTYTLTVAKTGAGSGVVTNTPTGTSFGSGTMVSLTAAPSSSSTFTGWSGACSGTTNPCTVTMSANRSVTANFSLKTYTLTASAGANGSINPAGSVTVNHGESRTFTITPGTGYRVANVLVDGVSLGAVGAYTFSAITGNHTISASFAPNTYTLTVGLTGTGSGTVTNSPAGTSFVTGTVVRLTAAPNANSIFSGWSGACSGAANPCSVTINANTTVTATFALEAIKPSSVIINPTPGATLRQSSCTITGSATDGGGSGVQKVEVSTDGGTTWKQTAGTNPWTYTWNIPGNGSYQIKSRATDLAGNVETPTAGISVWAASYQPTPVTVTGKQLLVNGTPFTVKGVVYTPVPIGEDPNLAPPYGDYFTEPYGALYERDIPLLRALGANTLRLYHWEKTADHFDFLDRAFNGGVDPIYIIAGYWIDRGLDLNPHSPANVREQLKADFREMVAAHKTHPAILMWSVGHNLNQDGASTDQLSQVFSLINEMAEAAQAEEGTLAHPVTTALADQDLAATIAGFENAVPALNVWGANVYRGKSFGSLFNELEPITQKPLLLMEYGIDAFDQTRGDEYEKIGTSVQADYAETLWKEIAAHGQTCVGGTILSYSDEWWKARYATDPGCTPDPDPGVQGR